MRTEIQFLNQQCASGRPRGCPSVSVSLDRQQVRSHWQAFLTKRIDRTSNTSQRSSIDKDNKGINSGSVVYKYEDWLNVIRGFHDPMKHNKSLLDLHLRSKVHIKPTAQKRQVKANQIYQRSVKRVDDLASYIQFVRDHKDEFRK
jgi:hypothetical protein